MSPPRPTTPVPEPDLVDDADGTDQLGEAEAVESDRRLWVRSLVPLLQLRSHDSDPSSRVQLAFDLMHVAVCERITRLARSDLGPDQR
jgi:hypothetical protein